MSLIGSASSSGIRRVLGFIVVGVAAVRAAPSSEIETSSKSLSSSHDPNSITTSTVDTATPSSSISTGTAKSAESNNEVNESKTTPTLSSESGSVRSSSSSSAPHSSAHITSTLSSSSASLALTRPTSTHAVKTSTTTAVVRTTFSTISGTPTGAHSSTTAQLSTTTHTTTHRSSSSKSSPTARMSSTHHSSSSPKPSPTTHSSSHSSSTQIQSAHAISTPSPTPSPTHSSSSTHSTISTPHSTSPTSTPVAQPTHNTSTPVVNTPTDTPTPSDVAVTPTPQPTLPVSDSLPVSGPVSSATFPLDFSSFFGVLTTAPTQSSTSLVTDSTALPTDLSSSVNTETPTIIPPSTNTNTADADKLTATSSTHHLSAGSIVGIVIGVIGGSVAILLLLAFLLRRRQWMRRRGAALGDGTDTYSNPFGDGKRYSATMAERERDERLQYAGPLVPTSSLLSPKTARDPFTTSPPMAGPSGASPAPPYDFGGPAPLQDQPHRQTTVPLSDAELAATYPAAGRLASYPSKKGWGIGGSKKKKLATMMYRPNSTLTPGERNSAKALIRIDSASSHEDHRGNVNPGYGGDEGHRPFSGDYGSPSSYQSTSYDIAEDGQRTAHQQHFKYDDQPQRQSPPRARQTLAVPSRDQASPPRPPRPESTLEVDGNEDLAYLITQRAGPSRAIASPEPPSQPPPAHFVQRSVKTNNALAQSPPSGVSPEQGGIWPGPSTFGEDHGTFGRSAESWHGARAV